jgi:hypothetical protein
LRYPRRQRRSRGSSSLVCMRLCRRKTFRQAGKAKPTLIAELASNIFCTALSMRTCPSNHSSWSTRKRTRPYAGKGVAHGSEKTAPTNAAPYRRSEPRRKFEQCAAQFNSKGERFSASQIIWDAKNSFKDQMRRQLFFEVMEALRVDASTSSRFDRHIWFIEPVGAMSRRRKRWSTSAGIPMVDSQATCSPDCRTLLGSVNTTALDSSIDAIRNINVRANFPSAAATRYPTQIGEINAAI